MTLSPARLSRSCAALAVGAVLLVPLQPAVSASAAPSAAHPSVSPTHAARATQVTLTAYGDTDAAGAVHLSGTVRWGSGKVLGRSQRVELWSRTSSRWVLVEKATTDRRGEVELDVKPVAHTTYQLRYAGSRSAALSSEAAPSRSPGVQVRAVAHVVLVAPSRARRDQSFVITGSVTPAAAGRVITLSGNGAKFTTLRTRADGSFSGRVRLQMTTTLTVTLPRTAAVDGASSGPHVVRVS